MSKGTELTLMDMFKAPKHKLSTRVLQFDQNRAFKTPLLVAASRPRRTAPALAFSILEATEWYVFAPTQTKALDQSIKQIPAWDEASSQEASMVI